MSELYEVYVFCAFYSGVVIFSLWMTVADRAPSVATAKVKAK